MIAYCSSDLSYVLGKCLPLKTLKILLKLKDKSCKQYDKLSTLKVKIAGNKHNKYQNETLNIEFNVHVRYYNRALNVTLTEAKT